MRILLTGSSGQIGKELATRLGRFGELVMPGRRELDLSSPDSIQKALREIRPSLIVNSAAYTEVDRAESEKELAFLINAQAPKILGQWAQKFSSTLVHFSTDYVFDGSGSRPWREEDPTGPLSVYGASKLAGESEIRDSGCSHATLRTSWIYSERGTNFLLTMLRLGREREELRVVSDQIGAPTPAWVVADAVSQMLEKWDRTTSAGTHHLTCSGETSWHGFAEAIFESARRKGWPMKVLGLKAIPSEEYPLPARRPLNSRLSSASFTAAFGYAPPLWQEALENTMNRLPVAAAPEIR